MSKINLDEFHRAYMIAALWSSTDENGQPLDDGRDYTAIADECRAKMRSSCEDFIQANMVDLEAYCEHMTCETWSGSVRAGHDFWLTRNGHGAGFWDRGLGAGGQRLSEAARVYGSVDLYVGDDGKIHGE